MTFHWAYEENGTAQPVEKTPSGNIVVIGVNGSFKENEAGFVYIDPEPMTVPIANFNDD